MADNCMLTAAQIWNAFEEHFAAVSAELSRVPENGHPADTSIGWSYARIQELLSYNACAGKRMRGLAVVSAYLTIVGRDGMDQGDFKIALTLGWAVELLQAAFLVADDIMDQSQTRRGKPCWYKVKGIGLQAVNDGMLLESCVFILIKRHCRDKPYYADLADLFREVIMQTELGQSLDMETSEKPEVDFTSFTPERYQAIVKYKTAFYSFYLPIAIALYITGNGDGATLKKAQKILLDIGCYFQVQDDYIDVYGDPSVTGKIGTDIESNKCSWLIVKALEKCTKEQRDVLQNNYGKWDKTKRDRVLEVFDQIGVQELFLSYEEETNTRLKSEIDRFEHPSVPKNIFSDMLAKIYQRKK